MTGLTCNAKMSKKFRSHLKYWIKIHRTSIYAHKKYGLSVSFGPKRHVLEGCDCKGMSVGVCSWGESWPTICRKYRITQANYSPELIEHCAT